MFFNGHIIYTFSFLISVIRQTSVIDCLLHLFRKKINHDTSLWDKHEDMSQVLCIQREIQLRFLCPDDISEVKKLCTDWFPIE